MRLRIRVRRRWTKLDWRKARSRSDAFVRRIANLPPILERSFIPFYDGLFPPELFVEPSELEGEDFSE